MNERICRETMRRRSDDELREIVRGRATDTSDEALAAAWRELRVRGITHVAGAVGSVRVRGEAPELPTAWLTFYAYIGPIGAALNCVGGVLRGDLAHAALMLVFVLVPLTIIAYGLLRRHMWGYRLNMLFFAVDLAGVIPVGLRSLTAAIAFLIIMLAWIVPNYVYFKKRIHLFN
jgi:hypothetical protein